MPAKLELSGRTFGLLRVIKEIPSGTRGRSLWLCQCDCGKQKSYPGTKLNKGLAHSCGCGIGRATRARRLTHGQSETKLYERWLGMLGRTRNQKDQNYGGRGIVVCDAWKNFEAFAADMAATFKPHLTLERDDVNGPYSPENCRWATQAEQQRNKRTNRLIEYNGLALPVEEWAERLGIKSNTIIARLNRGWTGLEALSGRRL